MLLQRTLTLSKRPCQVRRFLNEVGQGPHYPCPRATPSQHGARAPCKHATPELCQARSAAAEHNSSASAEGGTNRQAATSLSRCLGGLWLTNTQTENRYHNQCVAGSTSLRKEDEPPFAYEPYIQYKEALCESPAPRAPVQVGHPKGQCGPLRRGPLLPSSQRRRQAKGWGPW